MRLRFERELPVPPQMAWPYLTIAERMNLWSEAAIAPAPHGPSEGNVGSRRSVLLRAMGVKMRLHEVVVAVEEPHHFCYRVTAGGLLRRHRGTIHLRPSQHGTRLLWEVEFESIVPGASALLAAILRPSMERSLTALEAIVHRSSAGSARL